MGNNILTEVKTSIIIVAAGKGSRMKSDIPKQFMPICDRPILIRTLEKFHEIIPSAEFIIVMNESEYERWRSLCEQYQCNIAHKLINGGASRFQSVKNGLDGVNTNSEVVMIHDGVRPFINEGIIKRCLEGVKKSGAVIPVIEVVDSIRICRQDGSSSVANRADFKLVQTPQVFNYSLIKSCYSVIENETFTDDASVVEFNGFEISLCDGDRSNIKLTTHFDMKYGELLLNS